MEGSAMATLAPARKAKAEADDQGLDVGTQLHHVSPIFWLMFATPYVVAGIWELIEFYMDLFYVGIMDTLADGFEDIDPLRQQHTDD